MSLCIGCGYLHYLYKARLEQPHFPCKLPGTHPICPGPFTLKTAPQPRKIGHTSMAKFQFFLGADCKACLKVHFCLHSPSSGIAVQCHMKEHTWEDLYRKEKIITRRAGVRRKLEVQGNLVGLYLFPMTMQMEIPLKKNAQWYS